MKKLLVLYTDYSPTIDAIKYQLQDTAEVVCKTDLDCIEQEQYDLVVLCNYVGNIDLDALAVHYSLSNNFQEKNPVKNTIISGYKVTGITIFYTKSKKIIAQYPVFIDNVAHFDDIEEELKCIEQLLYPKVIDKILNNEPIEIKELMSSNSGGCSGGCCSSCKK